MTVVFTDLDGTLLDDRTYAWEPARPALEQLKQRGIPVVLVTSKTRAEVEQWREWLGIGDPFIVENGGAAYLPRGYFPGGVPGATSREDFEVLEWGTPYAELTAALEEASRSARCAVLGFHQMSVEQIGAECGLPASQAVLAAQREYDEPFRILEPERTAALVAELRARGLRWTEGGRFHHVCGNNDKALAVQAITLLFTNLHEHLTTIGLGDAWNDAPFLETVDTPVLVRSRWTVALAERIPGGIITEHPGPRGWNDAILKLIAGGAHG